LPLEEVWAVFTDFAKLASLVPGAELREVDGEECKGILKVRVGPVSVSYRGPRAWSRSTPMRTRQCSRPKVARSGDRGPGRLSSQ